MLQRRDPKKSDATAEESLTLTTGLSTTNSSPNSNFHSHRRFFFLFTLTAAVLLYFMFNVAVLLSKANHTNSGHPPILYGHVHMAKTGGTTLNGIVANKFDHVCGHKGYSYDAYGDNEQAKKKAESGTLVLASGEEYSRSRVAPRQMLDIGFEDCDYISQEQPWTWWKTTFGNGQLHGVPMQLHVPCRDPIEHLMSMCNYHEFVGGRAKFSKGKIKCDAKTDKELFDSVQQCFLYLDRYSHALLEQFDVKCYSFENQFTKYIDQMSTILEHRRFESTPYIKRETNDPRNKEEECIWYNTDVKEKVEKFLLDTVPYYQFCDRCMGSENEIAT